MATLFVMNATYQNQHFMYRVLGQETVRKLEIPPGCQMRLPDNVDGPALDFVLKQLKKTGAIESSEVHHIKQPRTLVYTIDRKPISSDKIDEAREKDQEARQTLSAEETEKSGLALLHTTETAMKSIRVGVKSTSLEIVEMEDENSERRANSGVDVEVKASRNYNSKQPTRQKKRG